MNLKQITLSVWADENDVAQAASELLAAFDRSQVALGLEQFTIDTQQYTIDQWRKAFGK